LYYILYRSITFATRIKNYFRYDGDYVSVVHTPSQISPTGCSYSVVVKKEKVDEVLGISADFGYKILGVFEEVGRGKFTEVHR